MAWGVGVLVAPTVPFLSFIVVVATVVAVADDPALAILSGPLAWLVIGGLLASLGSGRILRGIGVGLVAGAVATLVLTLLAILGGLR